MEQFWNEQAEWSQTTFGADTVRGPGGPLKHLAREVPTELLGIPREAVTELLSMADPIDMEEADLDTHTPMPTQMTAEEIAVANDRLTMALPQEVLRWAVERFHPRILMATAFGAEGCCIIHMLAEIEPAVKVINIDTGYQFPETLELRERILSRYGIAVEYVRPELSVPEYEEEHGGPLYELRSDQCCHDRKIMPLKRAMARLDPLSWISAIRKDQTQDRGKADVVQWDPKFKVVKVNPLLNWNKKDVWAFVMKHDVPYNPLHDQNYPSIGCWPCTRAVNAGEDDRAGRWAGKVKKECGLHVIEQHGDLSPAEPGAR